MQCNTFDGAPGASVTAVGARRSLLSVPGFEEDVGMIGIHYRCVGTLSISLVCCCKRMLLIQSSWLQCSFYFSLQGRIYRAGALGRACGLGGEPMGTVAHRSQQRTV